MLSGTVLTSLFTAHISSAMTTLNGDESKSLLGKKVKLIAYISLDLSKTYTHVKISQLVNKMCSQQACQQVVTKLLFYQVATRLSLATC